MALFARFNFELPPTELLRPTLSALPVVLTVQAIIAWRFGLYRGLWRFASLQDLLNILRAATLGALAIGVVLFLGARLNGIPRSVLMLYPLFLVFLLGGPRLLYRIWKDSSFSLRRVIAANRVLVVGGGSGGETVVRDMLREGSYLPVGIVDDDAGLKRARIHGVPVLGTIEALERLVHEQAIDTLVIAIPSATSAQMRRIVEHCEATGKPFRMILFRRHHVAQVTAPRSSRANAGNGRSAWASPAHCSRVFTRKGTTKWHWSRIEPHATTCMAACWPSQRTLKAPPSLLPARSATPVLHD